MSFDPSRRAFFRGAGKKVTETVVDVAEKRVKADAVNWIRPPYAVNELEFLLGCTRCDACVSACEPGVIFKLDSNYGIQVAGTPAMDLVDKACLLCKDWPCVESCDSGVLTRVNNPKIPEGNQQGLPPLARVQIDTERCLPWFGSEPGRDSGIDCGACVDVCPISGAIELAENKPVIDHEKCVGCAICRHACVTDPSSINIQLIQA